MAEAGRWAAGACGFCKGQQRAPFVKTGAQQTRATNNVTATNRKQCLKHTPDHTEHDNGADFFIGAENTTNGFSVLKSRLRSGNKGHS